MKPMPGVDGEVEEAFAVAVGFAAEVEALAEEVFVPEEPALPEGAVLPAASATEAQVGPAVMQGARVNATSQAEGVMPKLVAEPGT